MSTRGLGYAGILALVVAVVVGLGSIWYTDRQTRASQHQWCTIIDTLDGIYQHPPQPLTDTGKVLATSFHNLKLAFDC